MNRSDTAKLFAMLSDAYPAARVTEGTARIYAEMLKDLDFEPARNGVARLIATSKFFPSVAEVRESAVVANGRSLRSGAEAWLDVVEQIRHEGGKFGKPKFADPIVAEIVRRWGWVALSDEGDATADRARFIEMYNALAKQRWVAEVAGSAMHHIGDHESMRRLTDGIGNGGAK